MIELSEIVRYNALYLAEVEVRVNAGMGWVTVIDKTGDNGHIFIDGDGGYDFIEQAKHLYDTLMDITIDECYKHLAKPYVDSIWS